MMRRRVFIVGTDSTPPIAFAGIPGFGTMNRRTDPATSGLCGNGAHPAHPPMPLLRWFLPLGALLFVVPLQAAAQTDADLGTVRHVDLNRYLGRWYVIARVPGLLDRGKVAAAETYSLRPDGTLRDVLSFRKRLVVGPEQEWDGTAVVTDPGTNAAWKTRFFWPFWPFASTYRVLELDPNYGWAVVATVSGGLFRVLARGPELDRDTYHEIEERLRRRRLDPARLERVPQPAAGPRD